MNANPNIEGGVVSDPAVPRIADEVLMEMIQLHHQRGLELLLERYILLLRSISMSVLHNEADAEDLLQDVSVEIWRRAVNYDPLKGRPLSWITTLTRRRAIDRLRRRDTYNRVEDIFAQEAQKAGEGWTHVYEDLTQHERSRHLHRALASLPEAQSLAIRLAYHGQMSHQEIARHTGTPIGTIKTRLELGLRKMGACLSGHVELLGPGVRKA